MSTKHTVAPARGGLEMFARVARGLVVAACLGALTLPVMASGTPPDRPDLVGEWVLNKNRSDAAEDVDLGDPKPPWLGSGPGIGSAGPMSGAGVNGPLMGGRRVDPALHERMRALARLAFDAPDRMTVSAEGDTLRFVDEDGHATRLVANGSKVQELDGTLQYERRTKWDKDRLVTEVKMKDGGGEVKRVYTRDGDRMIIEATFEGEVARKTEKMRIVYDRKDE